MKESIRNCASLLTFLCATLMISAENLILKGSDTIGAKMVPQLAETFKASHPNTSFEISAEGSTTGIVALIEDIADIGVSSRRAKPSEFSQARANGVILKPTVICWDGIAVIVNEKLPIEKLSLREVEQIFTGDINDWSTLCPFNGKISLYTRNSASGTYLDFKNYAMNRRDYSRKSQKMAGNEQIVREVAANENAIGYVGLAYSKAEGIKVLKINDILPSVETVHDKTYPISRPNFFYTNGNSYGNQRKFIDFVLSEEGQEIVRRVGFVPLIRD
ncbi:MAG: phosphate ABC transporter substrate-binding protein [Opitutales bacterium]|nr:phosphate ABC transporter substrate-binding protein [Opitutales bacterium]